MGYRDLRRDQRLRDAQNEGFGKGLADDLQADGQAAAVRAAGNGQRGQAQRVDGAHQAGGSQPYILAFAADGRGRLSNARRGDGMLS